VQATSYVIKIRSDKASLFKGKKPVLSTLDLELTERCNNNCIHCYINLPAKDAKAKERELSTARIKNILQEAASLGCLHVRLTGGEPLLREDFEEIYQFARRLGLKVILFTNATLITPRLAALFSQIPPLEKIEISIYGMQATSYEAVTRVTGSYAAAWQGMNLLLEKKVPFVVKGAILPSNEKEMDRFKSWAAALPWMDRPPMCLTFFDLRCRRDSDKKNRRIQQLRLTPQKALKFLKKNTQYRNGMKLFCSKFTGPPGKSLFTCGSGIASGCVDAYGYFQPCMLLRHPETVYDLKTGTLKDGLLNFFPKVREKTATNSDYLARCAQCFLKGLCEQCPAKSWMENGTLDTPVDYLCAIAHAQAGYLGLLKRDETAWKVTDWGKRIMNFSGEEPTNAKEKQAERSAAI